MRIMEVIRRSEGGMREHYLTLVKGLVQVGYDVVALCDYPKEINDGLQKAGVRVIGFSFNDNLNPSSDFKKVRDLINIIKYTNPDIIHCHGFKAGVIGRLAAYVTRRPSLYTVHNFVLYNRSKAARRLITLWERMMIKRTAAVIAVSKYLQQSLISDMGLDKSKIHVVYNSKPIFIAGDKQKVLDKYNTNENEILIGTVARLIPSKGIDLLLKAIPEIFRKYQNIRLIIVGSGPDENRLKEIASDLNISSQIIFTGHVNNINDYYSAIDIFILPTLTEGLGISVIEAMSFGLPVIASNTGGIPELISHMNNGYLIQPGSSEAIVQALNYLLDNPNTASELGKKARADCDTRFTVEQMMNETIDIIRIIS